MNTNFKRMLETDNAVDCIVKSLERNNTFCPNITKITMTKRDCKVKDRKTGKNTVVKKDVLTMSFADGTWVDVARSEDDAFDKEKAFLYALAKRMFGRPTSGGYVRGEGFMDRVKDLISSVKTEKDIEKEKEDRIRAKEEADKKTHLEAVRRHTEHPTLGYRLRNLEAKFDKLLDKLGEDAKGGDSSDGGPKASKGGWFNRRNGKR